MNKRHGHRPRGTYSPTYVTWKSMRARCNDPLNEDYASVSYDPAWDSFEQFLADMGVRPAGTTLDRIDPRGAYCKANCRWATAQEQANNRCNARIVSVAGLPLSTTEWSELVGIPVSTLHTRLASGMSAADAVCKPRRTYATHA